MQHTCNWNTRRILREKRAKEIFEVIMTEDLPNLMADTKSQIQKAQRSPSKINSKKLHLSISKLQKIKKIFFFKEAKEKLNLTYKRTR